MEEQPTPTNEEQNIQGHIPNDKELGAPLPNDEKTMSLEDQAAKLKEEGYMPSEAAADAEAEENRPDWLPEKFQSAEEMAKAYQELEGKLGQPKAQDEAETTKPEVKTDAEKEAELKAATEQGKITPQQMQAMQNYSAEIASNGKLSEQSYKDIYEQFRAPKELVDQIIADRQYVQQAQTTNRVQTIQAEAGGADSYKAMVNWARTNLPQEQISEFNRVVDSGNIDASKIAVRGVYQQYKSSMGPNLKTGRTSSKASSSGRYESYQQFLDDIGNPKYSGNRKDPAFIKRVMDKANNSPAIFQGNTL